MERLRAVAGTRGYVWGRAAGNSLDQDALSGVTAERFLGRLRYEHQYAAQTECNQRHNFCQSHVFGCQSGFILEYFSHAAKPPPKIPFRASKMPGFLSFFCLLVCDRSRIH